MSNPYKFMDLPPINDCAFCYHDQPEVEETGCFYVVCPKCEACGPTHAEREKAIYLWNGPTEIIDGLRADATRLRRELDECNGEIR